MELKSKYSPDKVTSVIDIKHPCYIFNLTFVIYLNYTLQEDIEALPSMFFLPEHHLYGRI